MTAKERRQKLISENQCFRCGSEVEPGFKSCEPCRRQNTDRMQSIVATRKVNRRCIRCGISDERTARGSVHCARCASVSASSCLKNRTRKKQAKLCMECGGPIDRTGFRCSSCRTKINKGRALTARKLFDVVLAHYGPRCACCGETEKVFLTIDHIEGGGNKHRKELKNITGEKFCRWLIRNGFPEDFQILCYNCNCAKWRVGKCPHQEITEKYKSFYHYHTEKVG